jgi:YfiR/HmsC-like
VWRSVWRFVLIAVFTGSASADPTLEYQTKAVYLIRFAQFVEWPNTMSGAPDSPVVIGVLGSNPFGAYLDELTREVLVNGRHLTVQRFSSVEDIGTCHVLFISPSEQKRQRRILQRLQDRPILTVGDTDDFLETGGMIQFVPEQDKVRFRVARARVEHSGLTLSSKLLRAADASELELH